MIAGTLCEPTSYSFNDSVAASRTCMSHVHAVWRRATRIEDVTDCCDATRCFVPRTSAGAELTRGARRLILKRARRFSIASCSRHRRATGIAAGLCSMGRMRIAIGPIGRIEYRHRLRFAQPIISGCELRASRTRACFLSPERSNEGCSSLRRTYSLPLSRSVVPDPPH